ncbi:hypothetical protein K438DRAFT_1992944 [Mycena galopus ATCC 62051]|nr:hypothetical protein K438DRAFT_1992944 [Mycena galopus ATCC 62051]
MLKGMFLLLRITNNLFGPRELWRMRSRNSDGHIHDGVYCFTTFTRLRQFYCTAYPSPRSHFVNRRNGGERQERLYCQCFVDLGASPGFFVLVVPSCAVNDFGARWVSGRPHQPPAASNAASIPLGVAYSLSWMFALEPNNTHDRTSVPHFLLACPEHRAARIHLMLRLKTSRLSLHSLVSSKAEAAPVLAFVRDTGRFPKYDV